MALAQKLVQRQSQSLVMTPQLSQSIKLLGMAQAELNSFIEEQLASNPLLEISSDEVRASRTTAGESTETADGGTRQVVERNNEDTALQQLEDRGPGFDNLYPDDPSIVQRADPEKLRPERSLSGGTGAGSTNGANAPIDIDLAERTAEIVGLQDHLTAQLVLSGAEQTISWLARDVIANIGPCGWYLDDLTEGAERLGASVLDMERALQLVQSFDPAGIGARSLSECLKLQLQELDRLDPGMDKLVDNLELLAKRDFSSLATITGLDPEDLHDALLEIQRLDPKPGTRFANDATVHTEPDVLVRVAPDGSWAIELNNDALPRVLMNEEYSAQIASQTRGGKDKEFLDECAQNASWLIRSLDQRARTILRVSKEIVRQQDAFFAYGIQHLKPLTLKQVADAIDMHESSVSRVTSNKFMMTPRGMLELKFFFTSAVGDNGGKDGHSSEAVKDRIRKLIAAEDVKKVLSDDALVDSLRSEGVEIARRTVAKYREALNIPSSVQRRREKIAASHKISSSTGIAPGIQIATDPH